MWRLAVLPTPRQRCGEQVRTGRCPP